MKKWLVLILMVMFATVVFADEGATKTYRPNEVFGLSVHLSNSTGDVIGGNCSIQVRNESYAVIINDLMTEKGGGWYNYTYNTSKVGKYYCRQNCTQGDLYGSATCNFSIKGDSQMPLAIIVMLSLIVFCYLWLVWFLHSDKFTQHGIIKASIILFVFWFLLIPLNFGIESMGQSGASQQMINMVSIVHIVMIYLNILLTAYFVIFVIVSAVRSINENVQK